MVISVLNLRPLLLKYWDICVNVNDEKRIASQTPPTGVRTFSDIPYIDDGTWQHKLDVYRPESEDRNLPVIVDIHGGGWMYGTKRINEYYNMTLAQHGYTVFSINYRLVPECEIDGQLQDCMHALKWIKENAESYGGDLSRLYITGDSAGGFLAAYSTLLNNSDELRRAFDTVSPKLDIRAVGLTCPVCYMLDSSVQGIYMKQILGRDFKETAYCGFVNLDEAVKLSPMPPTYLITCGGDMPARKATYKAYNDLKKCGVECELNFTPDKKCLHVFNIVDPFSERSKKVNDAMLDFFKAH